jgi:hypothetical protein
MGSGWNECDADRILKLDFIIPFCHFERNIMSPSPTRLYP